MVTEALKNVGNDIGVDPKLHFIPPPGRYDDDSYIGSTAIVLLKRFFDRRTEEQKVNLCHYVLLSKPSKRRVTPSVSSSLPTKTTNHHLHAERRERWARRGLKNSLQPPVIYFFI